MAINNPNKQLMHDIEAQFLCDQFLGGSWLPVDKSTPEPQSMAKIIPNDPSVQKAEIDKGQQLHELYALISQCQKCPLGQTRLNIVPGQGNPNSRIVFVGEAPGQQEDQQGLAFIGNAGKLLTNIINAMGFQRNDIYIANILKCRPPQNRDPKPDEIMHCIDYLHQQLQIINPEIIVALGSHAAHTLLDTTTPIGQLRGKTHQYLPGQNANPIKLIATYHPAYLLRNYTQDTRLKVWQDMKSVLKELNMPIPQKK
ncbi:MAG: uracil-DNA glycosylase [Phycisphaerae bacterium]|nr:uracil-DNA glycosylase [Phycisphaerae bacterium]